MEDTRKIEELLSLTSVLPLLNPKYVKAVVIMNFATARRRMLYETNLLSV
jgi:hypothetical protein